MLAALVMLLCADAGQVDSAGFGTLDWQHDILAAQKLLDVGEFDKADTLTRKAFAEAKQLGKDHPFYTITLRHLSDAAYIQYRFDAAKNYSLDELEILRKLGPYYQDTVPVLMRLGEIALVEGKLEEAKRYLDEAKAIKSKAQFNPLLKAEINCRQSVLALANHDETEYDKNCKTAEAEWLKAVRMPKTGSNMSEYGLELARMSTKCNKKMVRTYRTASEFYCKRGLSLLKKSSEGLAVVHGWSRLSEYYQFSGRKDEMLACWQQAAEICMRPSSMTPTEKVTTLFNFAKKLSDEGKYQDAVPFYEKARYWGPQGEEKNVYCDVLYHLAFCYVKLNRIPEAIAAKRELAPLFDSIGYKKPAAIVRREIDELQSGIK